MGKVKEGVNKLSSQRMSRKEMRKQQRQIKKQTKQDNFREFISQKKKGKSQSVGDPGSKPKKDIQAKKISQELNSPLTKSLGESMKDELQAEKRQQLLVEKAMKKQRKRQLKDANKEEEKTIKHLEKQLKLNKRKNKSTPKSFVESGLDYILDVCDSSRIKAAVQAEMNLQENASEFEEDLAVITGKQKEKKIPPQPTKDKTKKNKNAAAFGSESEEEIQEISDERNYSDDDFDDDDFSDDGGFDDSDEAPVEFSSKRGLSAIPKTQKSELSHKSILENASEEDDLSEDFCGSDLESGTSEIASEEDDVNEDFCGSDLESGTSEIALTNAPIAKKYQGTKRGAPEGTADIIKKKPKPGSSLSGVIDDDHGGIDLEDEGCETKESEGRTDNGLHEDIYGRLRDKYGNVVEQSTTKYVPPHLRNQPVDDKKKAELEKLNKTIKGLLNRLAENNMHNISNQIDDLYMRHSRHDMNNTLLKQFMDSLISPVHTPERLVMEHAMLIAVLHANVGSEVGAFFLQHIGKRFDEMHSKPVEVENKELDNLILLLCHMYTFKIFDSVLLYDILQRLAHEFTPKDVDLILIVLRTVGFSLRKDNPLGLKDFILQVQKLANEAGSMKDDARVRFMLEILLSIKNNNVAKIPNYDTSHSEHLKKIIKPMFRKGNYVTELKITLEELLKADERGKWWVVGSAWTGPAPQSSPKKSALSSAHTYTQEILDLAKKHRMNTVNRKNIFCVLMSAEDYLDAFEKLLKLGLKGQPEQDIIHVLIHCLLSEKTYNPYYSHITDQLCMSDRRHRMTLQYAMWDRFKELKNHSNHQVTNLAKFLAHLFIQNSLPLSTLKVLEFTEMDRPCVRLLRQILLSLLLHDDQEAMIAVFSRVAKPSKLLMFRESVRLFMHHFLLKNIKDEEAAETVKLKDTIALAEQALMTFSDSR